jgi:hypothetical protein
MQRVSNSRLARSPLEFREEITKVLEVRLVERIGGGNLAHRHRSD